jgi:L-amino acid N-acyltransferase YncA
MASEIVIRAASASDAGSIGEIYDEAIATGIATFASGGHSPEERRAWLDARPDVAPVFVATDPTGSVVAWGALAPYSHREWYAGVAEYTVYVTADNQARGLGAKMISHLIEAAPTYGYWKLVGMILPENTAGLRLAARAGFRTVGTHRAHGQVVGRWRDVVLVERHLEVGAE